MLESERHNARVDLAACHRLAVRDGMHEGIDNHITFAVPGRAERFYLAPFGLHWSEVKASDFLEVTFSGEVVAGQGVPEESAFCIHAPVHQKIPAARCIIHTHMPYATSLTMLDAFALEPASLTAGWLIGGIAYDREFQGLALNANEGARLAGLLGSASILLMANHGVLVIAETIAEAFHQTYFLERACRLHILAMSTGRKLSRIAPEVLERMQVELEGAGSVGGLQRSDLHFAALKRLLNREEPDYAD